MFSISCVVVGFLFYIWKGFVKSIQQIIQWSICIILIIVIAIIIIILIIIIRTVEHVRGKSTNAKK